MEEKHAAETPKSPVEKPRGKQTAKQAGKLTAKAEENPEKLKKLALGAIVGMLKDESLKPSERLSAAKAILDYLEKQPSEDPDEALTVIFENLPEGFAD